ncbi:cytochrome P450 [Mycobacterium sp. 852014-50255_SCH5639931]|uniref:cytochrome P450 n=1 Tax=Mycobacterium sp. 852014-50255_SCH5639931 TaxID=1834112 RepID=UPI0007FF97E4|nr:cytochrome P450 [Mycobacterium sp. 852014-50255_SCH5639931]OBB69163.1 cytochrome [Mycobacterium sp. 852014-50255_SCH5639931]
MSRSPEEHARNLDLRHEDFNDPELLYQVYEVMRESAPFTHQDSPFVGPTPGGAWVATRYDDCYEIARNWESFSSKPLTMEGSLMWFGDIVITIDPPRQQQMRKFLNPYFSPGRMKQLEPQVRAVTDELIDTFIESGRGDLADVAWQQPGIVFFRYLLGMPVEDVPFYLETTDVAVNGETEDVRNEAMTNLYMRVRDEIDRRRGEPPRDDLIDVLLAVEIDGEKLRFDDVVANVMLLVQAGLETTSSAMSFAFFHLGTNTSERDRLISEPELMPTAIEEFIRYAGSIHGLNRSVTEEVELSGHQFCPGQTVVVNYAAANRDAREFDQPNKCILDRQANRHLGFGAGVHRCLGSNLARLEFRVGVEQVLKRLPDFTIPSETHVDFHGASVTRGYRALPVVFTPGARVDP